MKRRTFLGTMAAAASGLGTTQLNPADRASLQTWTGASPPGYAIIPVVGDGKWIWTKPPEDEQGLLEPRSYDLKVGIQLRGTGTATQLRATTAAPVNLEEQTIEEVRIDRRGCGASLRALSTEAGQLYLGASSIVAGQVISAVAHYTLVLHKVYRGFEKEQFPDEQEFALPFRKQFMYDSPGIQTRFKEVRQLAKEIGSAKQHPWDKARAFHQWVWENIKGRPQIYTSVIAAIRDRVGDCEERAAVFVALCRASSIPARLVWVPNHNWAEFYLKDAEGQGHWIPAHTSAYSWFGWTGAHELVLQKGDSVRVPEKRQPQRLLADWMQWQGSRPQVRYLAELTPLPATPGSDPGPGSRRKDEKGEWKRFGDHPLDPYLRDGAKASQKPPESLSYQQDGEPGK